MSDWDFAADLEAADEEYHRDHGDGEESDDAEAIHEAEQAGLLFQQIVVVKGCGADNFALRGSAKFLTLTFNLDFASLLCIPPLSPCFMN